MEDAIRTLTLLNTKILLLDFVNVLPKLKHEQDELDKVYRSILGVEKQNGRER